MAVTIPTSTERSICPSRTNTVSIIEPPNLEEYQRVQPHRQVHSSTFKEEMQMFMRHLETTLSIMGHVVFLKYFVTPNKAVEWILNLPQYGDYVDDTSPGPEVDLLECMLRTHWSGFIENRLLQEFEVRMYEEEAALAAKLDEEDLAF
jgi:hypothetical protein